MPLHPDELTQLVEHIHRLKGQQVVIRESLSRSRDIGGHDRHFATASQFSITIRFIGWMLSGSQLIVNDEAQTYYGINTDSIVQFVTDAHGTIEIIEQFEAHTERRTQIMRATYVQEKAHEHTQFLTNLEASLARKREILT